MRKGFVCLRHSVDVVLALIGAALLLERVEKLAGEILDALEQQGGAFKRKDDIYRMAQANRAFAHYRW